MGLKDSVFFAAQAKLALNQDEKMQSAFVAQTTNPAWAILTWLIVLINGYTVVAVTSKRIVLFRGGHYSRSQVGAQIGEFPRNSDLGNPTGIWHKITSLGPTLWVPRQFYSEVKAANDAAPATS